MLNLIYAVVFRHQKYAHLVVAILMLIAGFGMTKLWVTVDATVFFSDKDPVVEEYNGISRKYGEIKTVGLMLAPKSGNIFDDETLTAVREFTEEAKTIPYSSRVTSITNYNYIYDKDGDIYIEALLDGTVNYTSSELEQIKSLYLKDTIAVNRLVSDKGHVTTAAVALEMPEDPREAITEVFQVISEMEIRYGEKYPSIEFRKLGTVTGEYAFAESTQRDMRTLIPYSTLLIVVLMALLMRSVYAVGLTLIIIFASDVIAFGVKGYFNGVVSPMTGFAPSVILTIAVADCIHLLTAYLKCLSGGKDKEEALREALRLNYKAISLTSITTVIGFLCFNFSSSPAIRDMGNVVALGVFSAWMLTLFWLPTLIKVLPKRGKQSAPMLTPLMPILSKFVIRFNLPILVVIGIALPVILFGTNKNVINEVFIDMFDETYSMKRNATFYNREVSGAERLYFDIYSGENGGINNPEYLQTLEAFSNWLRAQPLVRNVDSYSDLIKEMNYSMEGEKEGGFTLPEGREAAAQYLLLYEMSASLSNLVTAEHDYTRLAAYIELTDSNSLLALKDDADQWLKDNAPSYMHAQAVSMDVLFALTARSNSESMYFGTLFALVLISIVVTFAIGNKQLGLVSVITNLLPILLAYGVWGYMNGMIGLSIAMVATLSMGIVVDDTIHFLTKFQDGLEKSGSAEEAILFAFENAGNAITVTSLIFISSFTLFLISNYVPNTTMGVLTAITISIALVFDLFFLPALLYRLYGLKASKRVVITPKSTQRIEEEYAPDDAGREAEPS